MKLSELVAYKTQLDKLSAKSSQRQVDIDIGKINNVVESHPIQLGNYTQQLQHQLQHIQHSFDQYESMLSQLQHEVKLLIETAEKPWFQESYRLYDEEMCHETTEARLTRRPVLPTDDIMLLQSRVRTYSDWRYPGLIIRPGLEEFIQHMVSFDPLYIVDQDMELLQPALDRYPEEYQRRLRPYVIKESLDQDILIKIPNEQFGICLVYNFFDFRPLEIIKKYLIEIYTKLRPGGTLIMTFNDCDRDKAVRLVEQHYACYTPGTLIRELAQVIGYQQIFSWNNNGPATWLELRKPGTLDSIKGGQTLAKIMHK
jgi:hypothetical protein